MVLDLSFLFFPPAQNFKTECPEAWGILFLKRQPFVIILEGNLLWVLRKRFDECICPKETPKLYSELKFFHNPTDVGNLISGSSAFSKTSLNIWKFTVHILLKPGLENFEHYFTSATQPTSKKCYVIPRLLPGLNEIQWDNTFNTHQILNTLLSTDCMLQKCHIP